MPKKPNVANPAKTLPATFRDSALHDYELGTIEINYLKGTVLVCFLSQKNEKTQYLVEEFISIDFEKKEEWGKGKYIVCSDAYYSDEIWNIEFQLNSGDVCRIKCKKL